MSLHAIRRALSASVLTARRPWVGNCDPFYTAANGLREILTTDFAIPQGSRNPRR
jgi:hypothetical protein